MLFLSEVLFRRDHVIFVGLATFDVFGRQFNVLLVSPLCVGLTTFDLALTSLQRAFVVGAFSVGSTTLPFFDVTSTCFLPSPRSRRGFLLLSLLLEGAQ